MCYEDQSNGWNALLRQICQRDNVTVYRCTTAFTDCFCLRVKCDTKLSFRAPGNLCGVSNIKEYAQSFKSKPYFTVVFDSLYLKRSIRQGLVCVVCNWKEAEKNHTHLSLEAIIEHFQIRPVFFLGLFHFCGMTKQILNYYTANISWKQTWKKMQLNWLFYSYGDFYSLLHSSSCTGYIVWPVFFFVFFYELVWNSSFKSSELCSVLICNPRADWGQSVICSLGLRNWLWYHQKAYRCL